jgi:hypothetical protein
MSLALLKSLVKTFPSPHRVILKSGSFRSVFCTEKPHSLVHSGDNYRVMGRCRNYNTNAPETRHKDAKKDAHKTNNKASVGLSILKCNLDAEADRRLTWLQDKTGADPIYKKSLTIFCAL